MHPVCRKSAVNAFLWREKLRLNRDVKICDSPASVPKGTPRAFSRNPKQRSNSPRESARGSQPSRTPSPRGCRGAERPTPASSEMKTFKRTNLHRRKPIPQKNSPRESSRGPQPSRTSNDFRRKSSPSRRGGGGPSGPAAGELAPPPACVKPLPRCAVHY